MESGASWRRTVLATAPGEGVTPGSRPAAVSLAATANASTSIIATPRQRHAER
jgi:hypothetical protein